MSTGPETTFIGSVHRHLPPADDLYSMKNHNGYNGGIADSWYSGCKADLWVEYKFIAVPKRDSTIIDLITRRGKKDSALSSLQQDWLRSRHAEGRNVAVIVGCKEGGAFFTGIDWDCTYTAVGFKSMLRSRKELAQQIVDIVGLRR